MSNETLTPKQKGFKAYDNGYAGEYLQELLQLIMVSDPWPLGGKNEKIIKDRANQKARALGFTDWVEAYHGL